MVCEVNEPLLSIFHELRLLDNEPDWLTQLRLSLPMPFYWDLQRLRERQFVKVGSTYTKEPTTRTNGLQSPKPSLTMMCNNVPVVGTDNLIYIPGEAALERALHSRWANSRIDPNHEFFWSHPEMLDLWERYA